MKKIGLVTFYDENYGSILQCYSTKKIIEDNGFLCEILYETDGKIELPSKFEKGMKKIPDFIKNCIDDKNYFGRWRKYKNVPQALTSSTIAEMSSFVKEYIKPKGYSYKELEAIGNTNDYKGFIVGSDQVWNVFNESSPIYKLDFSPRNKRIAFAVSLGVEKLNKKSVKKIKSIADNFDKLSVREESAKKLIEGISDTKVERIADPTLLLDKTQWTNFCEGIVLANEKYILVHFLNHPSDAAIQTIQLLKVKLNANVLCIGYKYEFFNRLKWIYHDCGPREYVRYINNANFVCTDSFHTTMFSINLEKNFYTFERMYTHAHPQTRRIADLLNRFNLSERFLVSPVDKVEEVKKFNVELVIEERMNGKEYLLNSIKNI